MAQPITISKTYCRDNAGGKQITKVCVVRAAERADRDSRTLTGHYRCRVTRRVKYIVVVGLA